MWRKPQTARTRLAERMVASPVQAMTAVIDWPPNRISLEAEVACEARTTGFGPCRANTLANQSHSAEVAQWYGASLERPRRAPLAGGGNASGVRISPSALQLFFNYNRAEGLR